MDVADVRLVLDEEVRPADLADVVEIAADPRQHRVGADRFRRGFRQVGGHDRVVVGPRGAHHQPLQERIVGRHQLQQLHRGDDARDLAEEGAAARPAIRAETSPLISASAADGEDLVERLVSLDQRERDQRHELGAGHQDAGGDPLAEPLQPVHVDRPDGATQEADEGQRQHVVRDDAGQQARPRAPR